MKRAYDVTMTDGPIIRVDAESYWDARIKAESIAKNRPPWREDIKAVRAERVKTKSSSGPTGRKETK